MSPNTSPPTAGVKIERKHDLKVSKHDETVDPIGTEFRDSIGRMGTHGAHAWVPVVCSCGARTWLHERTVFAKLRGLLPKAEKSKLALAK